MIQHSLFINRNLPRKITCKKNIKGIFILIYILIVLCVFPVQGINNSGSLDSFPLGISKESPTTPYITINPIGDQYLDKGGFFINGTTSLNSTGNIMVSIWKWPPNSGRKLMPGEFDGTLFQEVTIRDSSDGNNPWYVFINTTAYNRSVSREFFVQASTPLGDINAKEAFFAISTERRPQLHPVEFPENVTAVPETFTPMGMRSPTPALAPSSIITICILFGLVVLCGVSRPRK